MSQDLGWKKEFYQERPIFLKEDTTANQSLADFIPLEYYILLNQMRGTALFVTVDFPDLCSIIKVEERRHLWPLYLTNRKKDMLEM